MLRNRWLAELSPFLWLITVFSCLCGCSITATITDHDTFETSLDKIELQSPHQFKFYYGGAIRFVPVKNIITVEIDPSVSAVFNNELYFKANAEFRDGTSINKKGKSKSDNKQNYSYISVQNSIVGKNDDELFVIGLEHVSKLTLVK